MFFFLARVGIWAECVGQLNCTEISVEEARKRGVDEDKDACNKKSNQKNLGVIKSSNLCTEIIEYSAPDEVAVCNLASLALPTVVDIARGEYDFYKLKVSI